MILDTDYITEDGKPVIRIFKKENGEFKIEYDRTFEPYFYVLLKDDSAIEEVKKITAERHGTVVTVKRAEKVQKKFLGRPLEVWKLYFTHPQDVPAIRDKIRKHPAVVDIYEYDIPFAKRYLIDKGLIPMEGDEELKMLAFDIETLYHEGEEFAEGPILMISYADEEGARVITWKNVDLPYVDVVSTEREMIKRFLRVVKEKDPDVLITYNGDNFDFAYLKKRCEKLGINFALGRDESEPKIQRMGDRFAVEVKGRIHFDLYPVIRRTINLPTYTLEAVYEAVFGQPKEKVYAEEITTAWETGENLERVARYSMEDAKVTYELGKEFFPMEAQLSRLIGQPLWDVSRSSTGNLVEWFLLRKAYERNELAPNKPDEKELARRRQSYEGGYVKEPERGLWENIVYLDFRCHPADTKVVVKGKGIINISEVQEGDYVLGIDGWQRVRKVWEYDYKGELVNINGLKCTPNHKLPVVTRNERQTRIRDSLAKSFLTKKVRGKIITTPLFYDIGRKTSENIPEEEVLKGELAGILLAEGTLLRKDVEYFDSSRKKRRISHQYRVEITIGKDEEEFRDRITYIFERLFGIAPSISEKGTNAVTLKVAKKDVYLKVRELMDNIETLHAPSVLRGFFEGDGSVNRVRRSIVATQGTKNEWKIKLVSKLLSQLGIPHQTYTYQYQENGKDRSRYILEITGRDGLILFQTLIGFISERKNALLNKAISQREMNNLENNGFYRLSEFNVSTEYYEGKVYDLTLEGTPYYFANGILTHNSLYPSIIITHNVSPDTLNREGCKEYDTAPQVGHRFCKDFPGFIPSLLGALLEERQKIKKRMKATIDPLEKKILDYRQRAIKILANSILPDEWLPIIENGTVRFVRIGEFIDGKMLKNAEKVKRDGETEVLEVNGLEVPSFNRKTKKAELKRVKALIRHNYSGKVYNIRLKSGRRIKITSGHSLFSVRNGELVEVKGNELKPGDLIAVPRRLDLPERNHVLNLVELLLGVSDEETSDIVMAIPVKGRKNFFKGMLRTLRWIFGEEKRPRTARRYLRHLEDLGYVRLKKIGYEVLDWDSLKNYRRLYEALVENVRYNGNKREYLVEFNSIRDAVGVMPLKELKEWKIGTLNGFRMSPLIEVDESLAKLLGYYVSEGYAERRRNTKNGWSYSVKLYNEDPEVLNDMERLACKFFGKMRRGRNYVEIPKKIGYLLFENLCGVLAENKRIPEFVFTSPKGVRLAFLEGYFIGDGDVHPNKRLRLSTKSELLANQLVLLLNSVGVSAVKLGHDSGVYRVYINEELPFVKLDKKKNAYYSHVIPKEVLSEVFGKVFQKNVSPQTFRKMVEDGKLDPEKAQRLSWLIEGDVVLDRVESVDVEDYDGYVYDLSVEDNENFLVGFGLVYAHNSYYGYYGYAKARWYCKECAESVTAWGREYITMTIREIEEKYGFKVLYADSVTGDSEVIIRRNGRIEFVPIEKLFERVDYTVGEKEYHILSNVEALTLDDNGKLTWRKVPYVMRHKTNKKIYRIWLTNSWYLDVTEDHSLIGYLNTSRVKPEKPLKDRLCEVKPMELGKSVKSLITPRAPLSKPIKANEIAVKFWELVGLLVGDGNWGGTSKWAKYYVGLACGEDKEEITEKVLEPLKRAGVISNYYDKSKKGDVSILFKGLAKLMVRYFKDEAGNKKIPEFMFNLPREYVEAFLRGLFSADGTVSVKRGVPEIRLTTISNSLASNVRKLLWLVGISNSVFREQNPNRYNGKSSGTYSKHIRIKDKVQFAQRIGFILDRKQEKLVKNLKESAYKRRAFKYEFDITPVKKVEEITHEGYVYDIEVEGTHRFFANGILVHNTDGFFATIPGADAETVKKKAMEFLKYINDKLPGALELEYEGFYRRGFFVTKKKYAVIDEEGKITTRGLEIVRRDWSEIAKETQARVLEALLKDGDVEKAVRIVKEVTEKLSKYEVPPEKLVIHEQITRDLKDYKATGPHVAVAKRLAARGVKIRPGTVISYIVLKGSGRIGDRAIPFDEFDPTKHKYDAEYYIENQVLPAVERILRAFGYRKEDLRYQKTRQVGLGAWLKPKGT